jgi:hypothetical protein
VHAVDDIHVPDKTTPSLQTQAPRDRFHADAAVSRHPLFVEFGADRAKMFASFARLGAAGLTTAEQAQLEIEATDSVLRQLWAAIGGSVIDAGR